MAREPLFRRQMAHLGFQLSPELNVTARPERRFRAQGDQ